MNEEQWRHLHSSYKLSEVDDIKKGIILLTCIMLTALCSCKGSIDDKIIINEGENEISLSVYDVDTLNPIRTQSDSVSELMALVYEPLYKFGSDLVPEGCLAKNCIYSEDGAAVSIFLNKGIKWHDGTDFTAQDVIYTINEIKSGESMYKHNVEYIASAEEAPDGSVYLSLYEPVMNIEGLLSFPIIKNESAEVIKNTPCGTGDFRVNESGASVITLSPVADASEGSVSKVSVSVLRDVQACISAFETGEVDVITSAAVDLGEETPGGNISVGNYTANFMTFIGFNCSKEKYKEPYLRCVVSELVNRKEIIEKAVFGRGSECRIPINPQSIVYREPEMLELDIEGTMNKAGYSRVNDAYVDENGMAVDMGILVSNENARKMMVAEQICAQLKSAGLNAYTVSVSYDEYKRNIKNGNYDLFIGEFEMKDNLDPGFITAQDNLFRFQDANIDLAIAAMRSCRDRDTLLTACTEYARAFSQNPPIAPLYYAVESVVYSEHLSGMTETNFYNRLGGIENWYFKADTGKDLAEDE